MTIHMILVSLILIIFNYGFILLAFKFFGKEGLLISIPIVLILANIQVAIQVDFYGLVLTLGNVAYASSYLITDLLGELYSKKDAKRGVHIGFFSLIFTTVIMNLILLFEPTVNPEAVANGSNDFYYAVGLIFNFMPRIVMASMTSYIISQRFDVMIFSKLKTKHKDKKLWLRNNISTITSQLLDNFIFTFLAFSAFSPLSLIMPEGSLPLSVCLQIFITTYVVKLIISLMDTPFMYFGVWLKNNGHVND